jgi:hypothetical protein
MQNMYHRGYTHLNQPIPCRRNANSGVSLLQGEAMTRRGLGSTAGKWLRALRLAFPGLAGFSGPLGGSMTLSGPEEVGSTGPGTLG